MSTRLMTAVLIGLVGAGSQFASASDLSRMLDHSQISVSYIGGAAGPGYYGGGAQYFPQYAQYGGYPPVPATAVPLMQPSCAPPVVYAPPVVAGYNVRIGGPNYGWRGPGYGYGYGYGNGYGHGNHYHSHHHHH